MKKNSFFLHEGTFSQKKYNKLLVASMMAWLISLIDSCADSFLAGSFLSEDAVSAIALVQPFTSLICFFSYLVSVGTATMFSRESGAFNKKKASQYVGQGLICSVFITIFLVAFMLIFKDIMLCFYGANETITALANDYYSCEIFFACIYPFFYLVYTLVDIDGDEIVTVISCIFGATANLVSSLLMVEPFGIKGLAFGTIIGTFVAFCIYCSHFFTKKNSVKLTPYFSFKTLGNIVKLSSTTSVTLLYIAVVDIVMNKFIISFFSDSYLPAYAVINFILNLGAMFAGCYDSSAGFISVAFGEKNPAGIRRIMKIATKKALIVSLGMIVLLEVLSPYFADYYGITDPAVAEASTFACRVISLSFPFTALYYLYCGYYPAVDHVILGHVLSSSYMLVAPLGLSILLGVFFGFNGLSIGFALTSAFSLLIVTIVILIKYGKKFFPLVLNDTNEESLCYEIKLTPETIPALCEKVNEDLAKRNISATIRNEIQLILEEGYFTILEKNKNKKVLSECNILISHTSLLLITRDNGIVFDITETNGKVKSLRSYVLSQMMSKKEERSHVTTISFNRNSFFWDLTASPQ